MAGDEITLRAFEDERWRSHADRHVHEGQADNQRWDAHLRVHQTENAALTLASDAVSGRLATMNEIREQLNTERGNYATVERVDAIDSRMQALERLIAGNAGRDRAFAVLAGLMGVIVAIILRVTS